MKITDLLTIDLLTRGHEADAFNAIRYVRDAHEGEPLFVIRGRDMLAIPAITYYSHLTRVENPHNAGMIPQIDRHRDRFQDWQRGNPQALKHADPFPGWPGEQ